MITFNQIKKTYNKGSILALDEVSLHIDKGQLFGLIGPDGAGKTTLFRILTTLLLPDAGTATVNGFDIVKDYREIRNCIGYMPGRFSLYQDLTIEENLIFFATIFNTSLEENYDLIKDIYVQIEPFKTRRAGKLSGGMKQKLALCCALIHKPDILILDEPTTGVDAVSRKEFWEMLKRLKAKGLTILVSTPYMDEANLCDQIGLIQNGKILTVATPQQVIHQFSGKLFSVKSTQTFQLMNAMRSLNETKSCFAFGDALHATFQTEVTLEQILQDMTDKGFTDFDIHEITPTIEDCFIQLVNT